MSPPGAAPGAAQWWAWPEVRVTWGCTTSLVSPSRGITVQAHLSPSPPRARATGQIIVQSGAHLHPVGQIPTTGATLRSDVTFLNRYRND